jgi:hypothetical protein
VKEIGLSGKWSKYSMIVDDDIADEMQKHIWGGGVYCHHPEYAITNWRVGEKKRTIYAHRYAAFLYGFLESWDKKIDPRTVDHINHDGFNNTRTNLRAVSHSENNSNRIKYRPGTSIYRGVCKCSKNRWSAVIYFRRKHHYLGMFQEEIDAAKAFDTKARE